MRSSRSEYEATRTERGHRPTGRQHFEPEPASDVLQKLAQALDTTTDFLMMGSQDEAVSAQLADKELLKQFREVELLSPEDKHLVKTFIDASITKRHIQELAK